MLLASLAAAQDAQIQVKVPPRGSGMIVVDGSDTGVRAPGIISLSPGEHTIQVNGDCTTASQTITVSPGAKTTVNLEPQPVGGFAEIRVSDPGATLKVDGEVVPAPAMLPLSCGVHTLEASTGKLNASEELTVEMGGAYRITLQLTDAPPVVAEPEEVPNESPSASEPGTEPETDPRLTQDPVKPSKDRNGSLIAGGAITAVGAGALVAGGVVRAGALSDYKEFTSLDVDGDGEIRTPENTARANALWDDSIGPARTTSMALFIAGGVCVAAGTSVMVLVDDEGRPMVGYTGRF